MSSSRDLFSKQAATYATFRPHYPPALFEYLASLAPRRTLAWDCATGNGQAAIGLAAHFERVIATDASAAQLRQATAHPSVDYREADAEFSGLGTHSADLVTVAQALHWLDLPRFYAEVQRVLVAEGVIAVWGYDLPRVAPEIDALVDRFYVETVGPYWRPERRLVDEHYRTVPFPFAEITPPPFVIGSQLSLAQLLGYVRSWSATQQFIDREGRDPVEWLARELAERWTEPASPRPARWELFVRVGRTG